MKHTIFIVLLSAVTTLSCFSNSSKTYNSRHSFSITYPSNWHIYQSDKLDSSDLSDLQKKGGNYIQLTNYDMDKTSGSSDFTSEMIKIEIYIYLNTRELFNEKVKNRTTVKSVTEIVIGNNKAYKITYLPDEDGNEFQTIYYPLSNVVGIFNCYPADTKYINEYYNIIKSFKSIHAK